MSSHVLEFDEIDHTQVALVGGKGAQSESCPGLSAAVARAITNGRVRRIDAMDNMCGP